jgi:UDP-N-acetylglucosamine transferase subunit ALG13
LETLIRQLRKLESLIFEGKIVTSHRACGSIVAYLERAKIDIISEQKKLNAEGLKNA